MPPQPAERIRWVRGWLVPAALLAVAPKCVVCFVAYAGIGTALGLGGPELCGASETTQWNPMAVGALSAAGFLLHRVIHRSGPSQT